MAAPGGEKMKENEMSKILHQRSGMSGKEEGTCPFWERGFVVMVEDCVME